MLRLAAGSPPLWRDATTLQFGVDAVAVVADPQPWQLRLIGELERGIPDSALEPVAEAFGAPESAATDFVRMIARALAPPVARSPHVVLQVTDGCRGLGADGVLEALTVLGTEIETIRWHGAPGETVEVSPDSVVVVLAGHLVEPRRASVLMSSDVTHLPLVITGAGAEIGPVIVPGRTACLACMAAHRRDSDPAWPVLAAQLLGRPAPPVSASLASQAGEIAALLISAAAAPGPRPANRLGQRVLLRANALHRSLQSVPAHEACLCRSLAGSARAAGREVPATMTSSVFALPA